jgi:hypothetical protein
MTWQRGVFLAGIGIFLYTTANVVIDSIEFVMMLTMV